MGEPTSLGARLRARRTTLDLTLAAVAERAQLSLPYVSNLERGRGNPTIEALRQLAAALETSVAELLGSDEADGDLSVQLLAEMPASLTTFSRTRGFRDAVQDLATAQGSDPEVMRQRLLLAMAAAPRRSKGEPTDTDWRRLMDAYRLILGSE